MRSINIMMIMNIIPTMTPMNPMTPKINLRMHPVPHPPSPSLFHFLVIDIDRYSVIIVSLLSVYKYSYSIIYYCIHNILIGTPVIKSFIGMTVML